MKKIVLMVVAAMSLFACATKQSETQKTAAQFAEASECDLGKIVIADQGQFSIDNRDDNTPYIKKLRVVTTVTYSLKD